jgi:hypothetical protein
LLSTVQALNAQGNFDKTWECVGILTDAHDIKDHFCEIHDDSLKENENIQSAYNSMATKTESALESALDSGKSVGIAGKWENTNRHASWLKVPSFNSQLYCHVPRNVEGLVSIHAETKPHSLLATFHSAFPALAKHFQMPLLLLCSLNSS